MAALGANIGPGTCSHAPCALANSGSESYSESLRHWQPLAAPRADMRHEFRYHLLSSVSEGNWWRLLAKDGFVFRSCSSGGNGACVAVAPP